MHPLPSAHLGEQFSTTFASDLVDYILAPTMPTDGELNPPFNDSNFQAYEAAQAIRRQLGPKAAEDLARYVMNDSLLEQAPLNIVWRVEDLKSQHFNISELARLNAGLNGRPYEMHISGIDDFM